MRMKITLLFTLMLIGTSLSAKDFWQRTSGPESGNALISAIVINSSGNIFIGTELTGVYRSTNNGTDWIESNDGITNRSVLSLAVRTGGFVYAGTKKGLFISSDNGIKWQSTNYTETVNCIAITSAGKILIGTEDGVYASTNNGVSWSRLGVETESITTLNISAQGKIYAGTYGSGLFVSTDAGVTWELSTLEVSFGFITSMAINSTGTILYVGTYMDGLYKSIDGGTNWTLTQFSSYLDPNCIAFGQGNTVFVGSDIIYKTTNAGTTWVDVNVPIGYVKAIALNASGNIFAGSVSAGGGVCRSTNAGTSWSIINNGFTNISITAMAEGSANRLYAGSVKKGLFFTDNQGSSWTKAGMDTFSINSIYEKAQSNLLVGTNKYGLYELNGTTPTQRGMAGLSVNCIKNINGIFFAGTSTSGLYKSTDNGTTWTLTNLSGMTINDVASTNTRIFAASTQYGIHYSSDAGISWTQSGLSGITVTKFATKNNLVFAATQSFGIYKTTNDGLNWIQINNTFSNKTVNDILIVNAYIFASVEGMMYYSSDMGVIWNQDNSGLYSNVITLSTSDNYVLAGTDGSSVFKSVEKIQSSASALQLNVGNYINPVKAGDILNVTITVLDNNNAIVANADINITDNLNNVNLTLKSDFEGKATYSFKINDTISNGSYLIKYTGEKSGFTSSPEIIRTITIYSQTFRMSIISANKDTVEWGEKLDYQIKVSDEKDLPVDGASIQATNIFGQPHTQGFTNTQGVLNHSVTIPDSTPNGLYSVYITTTKLGFRKSIFQKNVYVKHGSAKKLILTITPANQQELRPGDSLVFTINVKDNNLNPEKNTIISIQNNINNTKEQIQSDANGKAEFSLKIPQNTADGLYQIKFQSGNSDTSSREIKVNSKLSINDFESLDLSLYPNPASDQTLLNIGNSCSDKIEIVLYDMSGKALLAVFSGYTNQSLFPLSIAELPNGTYYLDVKIGSKSKTLKLTKTK